MKKLLLSLAVVLGMSSVASAADVTLPASGSKWSSYTWTQTGTDYAADVEGYDFKYVKGSSSNALVKPDDYSIRIYGGASLTITAPSGKTFKSVKVVADKNSKALTISASSGWTVGTPVMSDNNVMGSVVVTAATPQSSITITGANNKQLRLASVVLSDGEGGGTVDPDPGESIANTVETAYTTSEASALIAAGKDLSTEVYVKGKIASIKEVSTSFGNATYNITDGTKEIIVFRGYYFDGAKFTSEDQIKVGDDVVVLGKLTSFKGDDEINSGNKIVLLNGQGPAVVETVNVNSIAQFKGLDANTPVKFTIPLTAVYQNGLTLYVTDGTDFVQVRGDLGKTYQNGMTIAAGVEGKVDVFRDVKQLAATVTSFSAGVAGTPVHPAVYMVEEISNTMVDAYVKVENATVTGADRNFTITDETGQLAGYQSWTNVEIPTGENLNVVGFISLNNKAAQLCITEVTDATGEEFVAAPVFTPASGALTKDETITITCATAGADIYYTLDGNEPSAASTKYTAPIAFPGTDLTVKAIAIKEGMANSDVVTATYTLREVGPIDPSVNEVTFDFAEKYDQYGATLGEKKADGKDGNEYYTVTDQEFINNGVIVKTTTTSGTGARVYYSAAASSEGWTYRFYKNGTLTITAPRAIESIAFTGKNVTNIAFAEGTYAGTGTKGTWTNPAETTSVSFGNTNGTASIATMVVTLKQSQGVDEIEAEDQNAPAVYYNLQGVRVDNPANGLFIRVQGKKATKVLVR